MNDPNLVLFLRLIFDHLLKTAGLSYLKLNKNLT